jgi:hypothetical protein
MSHIASHSTIILSCSGGPMQIFRNRVFYLLLPLHFLISSDIFASNSIKDKDIDAEFSYTNIDHIVHIASNDRESSTTDLLEPFRDDCARVYVYAPAQNLIASLRLLVHHLFITPQEYVDIMQFISTLTSGRGELELLEERFNNIAIHISKFLSWRFFIRILLQDSFRLKTWTIHGAVAYLNLVSTDINPAASASSTALYLQKATQALEKPIPIRKCRSYSAPSPEAIREQRTPITLSASVCEKYSPERFDSLIAAVGSYRDIEIEDEDSGFAFIPLPTTVAIHTQQNLCPFLCTPSEEDAEWDDADAPLPPTSIEARLIASIESADTSATAREVRPLQKRALHHLDTVFRTPLQRMQSTYFLWQALINAAPNHKKMEEVYSAVYTTVTVRPVA